MEFTTESVIKSIRKEVTDLYENIYQTKIKLESADLINEYLDDLETLSKGEE